MMKKMLLFLKMKRDFSHLLVSRIRLNDFGDFFIDMMTYLVDCRSPLSVSLFSS